MLKTISLLGVNVSRVNPVLAVRQICEWVGQKQRTYVCVAPVSTLVDAQARSLSICRWSMPRVWSRPTACRLSGWRDARGCKDIARTYGPDLMLEVCNHGQDLGLRHFFYGGTEDTLRKLQQKLLESFSADVGGWQLCSAVSTRSLAGR